MTTVTDRVQVDSLAMFAWRTLPEADRLHITQRLDELSKLEPSQWHEPEVRPIRHLKNIYLLAAPNELRVAFRREDDGKLTVYDIVLQGFFDQFVSPRKEAVS